MIDQKSLILAGQDTSRLQAAPAAGAASLAVATLMAACIVGCGPAEPSANDIESLEQSATLSAVAKVADTTRVTLAAAELARVVPTSPAKDCSMFDAYTAALATSVIDCLGTIGPDVFAVDEKGYLNRRFDKCLENSEEQLANIDGLLSLQVREHQRPNKSGIRLDPVACISGRYQRWAGSFKAAGIRECPRWVKTGVIGETTPEVVATYTKLLPQISTKGTRVERDPPVAKRDYAYKVYFASGIQDKGCQDPASCAAACVSGFPGALVKASGEEVLLDPTYWLDATKTTVYTAGGYYHGMSYYGGPPGDLFGHINRQNETCSYYDFDFDMHYLGKLKPVQIGGMFASWMTECMP
ncbi:MAG TPA: hypothetical protein VFQ61_06035 [Polyangiaceae bacterium]|nr:hypothetical protein [Polyangiaceae bacterium]